MFRESPEHTDSTRIVRWVKVANFPDKNLQLGLSASGFWVREGLGDVCELDVAYGLVPLYPCLELEPSFFQQTLAKSLSNFGLPTELAKTFPVNDLVEQALKSGSDHWTKLSLQWVNTTAATDGVARALKLLAESQDKRMSQHTRQGAKRILKIISKGNGHAQS
jgi:hypothetical protein